MLSQPALCCAMATVLIKSCKPSVGGWSVSLHQVLCPQVNCSEALCRRGARIDSGIELWFGWL